MAPFLLLLLAIAVLPLTFGRFWERNLNKLLVALALSLPVVIVFLARGDAAPILHSLVFDYVPFIVLLGALFTITGGIHLSGDIEARPAANTLFLGAGAVLASLMGTTGAAMLLIRPVLHTNKERHYKVHTILFFIAIVANCGGLLSPLGDPPLFMMYLRGAPFAWFLRLLPEWLTANGLLLLLYFFADRHYHGKEPVRALQSDKTHIIPLRLHGPLNFVWLLGVILAVAWLNEQSLPGLGRASSLKFAREGFILAMAVLSWFTTRSQVRRWNHFSWHPILEVGSLFLGIFITMVPCLLYLQSHAASLGVHLPGQFYYASGTLSSVLDNTPTAVTFHSLALGLGAKTGVLTAGIPDALLKAIAAGAVFFGGMTYIGNGPNFMVKAVAEHARVKMPHFFGYMIKFSLIVLLPIFVLVQLLFIH
ncbi:MAG: sodium:proton antiporter [Candidatus Aminicenantales bacterium]